MNERCKCGWDLRAHTFARHRKICDEFESIEFAPLQKRIAALEAQLAEARKDSERLEWMARNHAQLCYYDVKRTWWVEYLNPNSSEEETLTGPDIQHDFREAIDAAIEAAGKGSGE